MDAKALTPWSWPDTTHGPPHHAAFHKALVVLFLLTSAAAARHERVTAQDRQTETNNAIKDVIPATEESNRFLTLRFQIFGIEGNGYKSTATLGSVIEYVDGVQKALSWRMPADPNP